MVSMTNCSSKVELSGLDFLRHGEGGGGGGGGGINAPAGPFRNIPWSTTSVSECV